ncbi:Transmembrane protein 230 [Oryzias melastigma]|uniref:Transmembrane protein 230 n=1 Tax=Oryzias melastigma TaxID=30732 RepID=A0A834F5I0_ORYME|nr:Transmembrane protein 230 [Oryzias melastigma]
MKAARSTMLAPGLSNNKAKYSRLAASDDGYIDLQFQRSPPKIPYNAIALAIFLFLIGSLLIIFGALLLTGTIKVEVLCFFFYIIVNVIRVFQIKSCLVGFLSC